MFSISVSVLLVLIFRISAGQENNVCPTFDDYYTVKNNTKCWYNPAAEYRAHEIIQIMGYPLETYRVTTSDGYILTLFRIPSTHTNNQYAMHHPVYLQHGIGATCDSFVTSGRNSLAFVLSDAGYDVWLGNYRGNPYSEDHVNLTVYDQEYWDHSIDDIALLDVRAMFHTILRYTEPGSKIIFIGHSLGTAVALMYGSEYPEESKSIIKLFVLLCPAYTLTHMISPYGFLAPFGDFILDTVRELKLDRIVSQTKELRRLVVPNCVESPETMRLCMQVFNLFYGAKTDLGPEMVPVHFNQVPSGTSIKVLNHAAHFVLGKFRKYDYKHLNIKYYGTHESPIYDISRLHVPVYIVVSKQDWATPEADAINLWNTLPDRAKHGFKRIDEENFNHIDFVFGRRARQLVYDPLVKVLNRAISN